MLRTPRPFHPKPIEDTLEAESGQSSRLQSDVAAANSLFFEVLLMVILGTVELGRGADLRHDGPLEDSRFVQRRLGVTRRRFLLRVMVENGRAILAAVVGAL